MGSPSTDSEANVSELPQHEVILNEGFWLAETVCTQALWEAVMGDNPCWNKSAQLPVGDVSWNDVQTFIAKLNERVPGLCARLPTEAEWEYAARAGTTESRYGKLDDIAWYGGDIVDDSQHPVAQKQPNAYGLYDMLGNVWEWTADRYAPYESGAIADPLGPREGSGRVIRGGAWSYSAGFIRAAARLSYNSEDGNGDLGFRIARGYR